MWMATMTTNAPILPLLLDEEENDLVFNATLHDPGVSRSDGSDMDTFHLAVAVICLLLCVLGLLGNTLVVVVWSDTRMQRSSPSLSILLMGLAAFDLVFLVCLALSFHLYSALYFSQHSTTLLGESTLWVVQALTYPPMHVFRVASIYVTVAVTLERALAVTRPLKAMTFSTKVNSRLCLLCIGIASVIYNFPRFWERHLVTAVDPTTNQTYIELSGTAFTTSSFFRIYNLYIQFVVVFVVPFTVIFVCNSAILWTLHRKAGNVQSGHGVVPLRSFRGRVNARMERSNGRQSILADTEILVKDGRKSQRKGGGRDASSGNSHLTATVMALTLCFFVTHLVPAVSLVLKYMEVHGLSRLDQGSPEIQYLQGIGHVLVTFNSASNFLFFSLLGRKFRTVLMSRSFCCRRGEWRRSSQGTTRRSETSLTTVLMHRVSTKSPPGLKANHVTRGDSVPSPTSPTARLGHG